MDRIDHPSAQIIPFPTGGRDAVRRPASGAPTMLAGQAGIRSGIDCSAWYHQAAMQEAAAPRRS